jgi:signal transduction histidine kinase
VRQGSDRPIDRSDRSGSDPSFIVAGGETGALMRTIDWGKTPLGPQHAWPQSLRTALSICLSSRFPIALFWGPEFVMLYNDDLLPMVGANKHPHAMGRPGLEVLAEIRDIIEPMLRRVSTTGDATWSEDLMLPLLRDEVQAESYFTFTYSPIRVESGGVGGVFCAVIETTARVIEERRLRLLNSLAEATRAKTPEQACADAALQIARFPQDVPFALLYLLDDSSRVARLTGIANMADLTARSPTSIPFGETSPWPFGDLETLNEPRSVELDDVPGARGAVILPIERSGGGRPFGFIVAGLAPLLPRTESYDRFHKLLSASISQAVSSTSAFEEERKRAEALAELDRAKTTFFGNVSHEFRTPLTLLLGPAADALGETNLPARDRERWELVHGNAQRLQKLVNTLLDFSRIEAGRAQARFRPTDLASLTIDLASAFRSAIERAGLTFEVDCPPFSPAVYVDHDMWEKIVLNLLSNALKFTHEGTISVSLRWRGDHAELHVRDSGTGIAQKDLAHLFERFRRVEGTRARTHEGSGIGLALVQELVRLHGGSIRVDSVVGEGTRFTVLVPGGTSHLPADRIEDSTSPTLHLANADAYVNEALRWLPESSRPSQTLPASTENGAATALPFLLDRRILVADDNPDMRSYIARILRTHWTVDVVENGEAALRRLAEARYDLVLCDVMMPGLDGFALLRAVRSDPRFAGLPVIMLSARAGEESRVEGLHAGADDYLVKPFSARELVARVSTHLALGRARAETRLARDRLRTFFMQAPIGVSIVRGHDFVYELANPAYERMVGRRDIVGKSFREVFPELNEDAPVLQMLRHILTTGEPFTASEYKVPLASPSGAIVDTYFLFTSQPVRSDDGTLDTILTAAIDVTEQVRLREGIERARQESERASLAKDEFLATASHELRTPLNAILGWARLLRAGQLDPSGYLRAVETIERNAKSQVQLIEDILDGSRIITGKLRLEIRPLDMTTLVSAAMDAIRPAAEAKSIRVSITLDPMAARIVGDPGRLQQVVWNLANNAIKFTPRGGSVEVRLERVGTSIQLAVLDSGQGISSEFLPHVFERFRQADGSSSRRHGGLGLGLALVRHLVEAHGGTVRAESAGVDRGARFIVTLPVQAVYEQAPSDAPRAVAANDRGRPLQHLYGVRVLVVDDEEDARDLVATVLRAQGAEVTTASSAAQVMDLLSKTSPTVLISDIGMPETDGYELIRRVRTLTSIPAIALTAYAREEDRRRALEAGFQAYVAKPVEPAELVRVVAALLSDTSRHGSAEVQAVALERADTFLKFEKVLEARGIHEALHFLNSRTPHRFTGVYRFDPPMLRNLHLVDSYAPQLVKGEDAPMAQTYCSIVADIERPFTTEESRRDDRLRTHPARENVISYCGVLLRDELGKPFGTLCHFDQMPCGIPVAELPLMEAAAPYLMKALRQAPR